MSSQVYVLGEHTAVSKRTSLGDNYLGDDHGAGKKGITQLGRISCKSVPNNLSAMQGSASPDAAGGSGGGGIHQPSTAPRPQKRPEDAEAQASFLPKPLILRTSSASGVAPEGTGAEVTREPSSRTFAEAAAALAAANSVPSPMADLPPKWFTDRLAAELRRRLGMNLFNFDLLRPEEQPLLSSEVLYYVIDINYFPGVDKIHMFEERFVNFLHSACTSLSSTN